MAQNYTRTLKPSIISTDRDSVAAVQSINTYAPANSDYTTASLVAALADYDAKAASAAQADAAAKAARDDAVAAAHRLHNKVVGMRDSVGAQFGKDSNEFQAVGRKKTTEYKKPTRTNKQANNAQS
jgi:hypothetical protein